MPNWCYNRVRLIGDEDCKEAFLAVAKAFESEKPFNAIVPEPDWSKDPLPEGERDERWYGWRLEHWGTKWDLNPDSIEYCLAEEAMELELTFDTAWCPPEKICEAIRDKGIDVSWFWDEPGMQQAGYL